MYEFRRAGKTALCSSPAEQLPSCFVGVVLALKGILVELEYLHCRSTYSALIDLIWLTIFLRKSYVSQMQCGK